MKNKAWIAERCSRARATALIMAKSRKEAQEKLNRGEGDVVNVEYYDIGRAKVVRLDKPKN